MKTCVVCKAPKDIEAFSLNKRKRDGRQSYCRECQKPRQHAWYTKNRARHIENVNARTFEVRKENVLRLYGHLETHPCVDCGEADPVVLDFDHVRGVKKTEVVRLVWDASSWKTIQSEIEKCEVRCANCHRRKTARERNTWRFKLGTKEIVMGRLKRGGAEKSHLASVAKW